MDNQRKNRKVKVIENQFIYLHDSFTVSYVYGKREITVLLPERKNLD